MSGFYTPFGYIPPSPDTIITGFDAAHTSHTLLQDIGSNTHAQIDTFVSDINTKVNQDVRTTATPTFAGEIINGTLTINTSGAVPMTLNTTSSSSNNEYSLTASSTQKAAFGHDDFSGETYVWVYANEPIKFATNNAERIRIAASGIANDNTITNILGLNGTTLSYKNNIVDTTTSQTLSSKNIAVPGSKLVDGIDSTKAVTFNNLSATTSTTGTFINTNTASRSWNLPDASTTLIGTDTTNTLSNKTINSASNTITITNSPLSAVNVNSLINQDIRTSAAPSFTGSIAVTQSGNSFISITSKIDLGYSNNANAWFTGSVAGDANLRNQDNTKKLNLGVGSSTAQLSIANTAITANVGVNLGSVSNDNSITNILGLNGTSVVYKNNIVDTSSTQTLTNKTINSASNTITITNSPLSAVNVNSLINQDIRTTATPTFASLTLDTGALSVTGAKGSSYGVQGTYLGNDGIELVNNTISTIDFTNTSTDYKGRIAYIVGSDAMQFVVNGSQAFITDSSLTTTFSTDKIIISTAKTPASASAAGTAGTICWDSSFIYVCVATNTWLRSLLTTWV